MREAIEKKINKAVIFEGENFEELMATEIIEKLETIINISKYCLKNQCSISGDNLILY